MSTNYSSLPAGEFLSFRLDMEEYGIDILKVQEIRGYSESTHIANANPWLKGVMDLRGVIVPIVDLRIKFGLEATYTDTVVTIVLSLTDKIVGIVVDSVSDVIKLVQEDVRAAPNFGDDQNTGHVIGLATIQVADGKDRMIILSDVEKLIGASAL